MIRRTIPKPPGQVTELHDAFILLHDLIDRCRVMSFEDRNPQWGDIARILQEAYFKMENSLPKVKNETQPPTQNRHK